MKEQDLLKALGEIREDYILEADPAGEKANAAGQETYSHGETAISDHEGKGIRNSFWKSYGRTLGALAAALILVAGVGIYQNISKDRKAAQNLESIAESVAEEALQEDAVSSEPAYSVAQATVPKENFMSTDQEETDSSLTNANLKNPWITCSSLADAKKIAGFSLVVPEVDPDFPQQKIYAVADKLIEVRYEDADGNEGYRIRKGIDTESADGDFLRYDTEREIKVNDREVTLKGNGTQIELARWRIRKYSYSLTIEKANLTEKVITDLIRDTK